MQKEGAPTVEEEDNLRDGPFAMWRSALEHDKAHELERSATTFARTADSFSLKAAERLDVSRAYYQYSTLMDAFSSIQRGRCFARSYDYEHSLAEFSKASEILRATVHFGFLAPFVTACGSLELARDLPVSDNDYFQAHKNAIALFGQAKIALGFRDERHPVMKIIDCHIMRSMAGALTSEAALLRVTGATESEISNKSQQAERLRREHEELAGLVGLEPNLAEFFPIDDYRRVQTGPLILAFPEKEDLLLTNVGTDEALVSEVSWSQVNFSIDAMGCRSISLTPLGKGRIRIRYAGRADMRVHDEGLLSII